MKKIRRQTQKSEKKIPMTMIYGPDGNPLPATESIVGNARERSQSSSAIRRSYSNYLSSLFNLNADALYRSTEPFENHAWVYCTAMVRAINLSQAPFYVYKETSDVQQQRVRTKSFPRAGLPRRAVQRHLTKGANPGRFARFPAPNLSTVDECQRKHDWRSVVAIH